MTREISWDPARKEFKPVSMTVRHTGGMSFSAITSTGLIIPIDAHVHLGGGGTVPNPIDYLFASLGGCIGIKILLDLGDIGIRPDGLQIETTATRKQDLPATFETVHHVISLKGEYDEAIISDTLTKTMTLLCPIAVIFGETSVMTWEFRMIQ
ncbi:MAG TPA: OsmC family protein [Methanospirillum sp.]|uniref:OsmC family protein n=1 Tax=Methanospirillum sp. TaxID=45200 RepID=UPI002B615103|nr:OsmC family protein [Methanospirillum sp.]HOJ96937.1 OsmC family protein [Methanospirillum sp.]HOL41887.1 OsmC family protein [Methanospirillum sp.]HPP77507.1 OsmC family protein [Methanospirillum sp.]